jgi:GntR family transcriptional repressor for pyruvate dehydrogenase complex
MVEAAGSAPTEFRPARVLKPRQQVEEQLKSAILSGALKRGDRLPSEAKLAEQFSVSRPTVREALGTLAEKGLIHKTPGTKGGSFVQYIDHHSVTALLTEKLSSTIELGSLTYEEVAQVRNQLEIPSARLAAEHRTDEQLDALHAVIEEEKSLEVTDDGIVAINAAFHRLVAESTGNRLLSTLVVALHQLARPMEFVPLSPEAGRLGVIHHIEIVKAIREQDPDAAAEAMQKHLDHLRTQVNLRAESSV